MMENYTSPFMDVKQTAEYLQIHKVTLYRMVGERRLPYTRLGGGGKILFNKSVLDEFLITSGNSKGHGKLKGAVIGVLLMLLSSTASAEVIFTLAAGNHARIAPHFTMKEFACKCCGQRKVSGDLLWKLELLRLELKAPIMVTSGYRCRIHNRLIRGAKHSQHVLGKAADIKVDGFTSHEVAIAARKVGFSFVKEYKTWTHVDVR